MSEGKSVCALCQETSTLKCGRCQKVVYCSKEHQKLDWKKHRKLCELIAPRKCFKIVEDEKFVNHLVATRYILQGETVLVEDPMISGPKHFTPPVCLGCYKFLHSSNNQCCSRCNWPVCSEECENSFQHRPECEITMKHRQRKVTIRTFGVNHPTYQSILVLRCLYLSRWNRTAWERLNRLRACCEERMDSERYREDLITVGQLIPRFFNYYEFSCDEILRIAGIVEVNSYYVPAEGPGYEAIYYKASFLDHSCFPNCSKSFTEGGKIIIKAARPILKGERFSISFTLPLWTRQKRQDHLWSTKYFICKCIRCSDPTEMGTNFGSYKCIISECEGYVIPVLSGGVNTDHWRCMKCGKLYEENDESEVLFKDMRMAIEALDEKDPKSCKEFWEKCKKFLPPYSYFMIFSKLLYLSIFEGEGIRNATEEDIDCILEISNTVLEFAATLVPADIELRGTLHFYLYIVMYEIRKRKCMIGDMNDFELKQNILASRGLLKRAYAFLPLPREKLTIEVTKRIHGIVRRMGREAFY